MIPTHAVNRVLRWVGHLHWVRFGIRDRIIRTLWHQGGDDRFEVDFFGLRYSGRLGSFLDWSVYFFGAYEASMLELFADVVGPDRDATFIDVGANEGHHSLFMGRLCQVHAMEPDPRVRERFERRLAENGLDTVWVHAVGLGAADEMREFYAAGDHNTGMGSFLAGYHVENRSIGSVAVVNGDRFLADLGPMDIRLIKIDVEGFERAVVEGLRETLEHHRPHVVMEFSRFTRDSFRSYREMMSVFPAGYRVRRIEQFEPRWLLFNKPGYRLCDFDFGGADGELLFMSN
ncbi:MAG: FkbM family methyltransferase [Gammaproteobacteria bacterium]